ncbi:MAG: uracil phosphoribosyltransferase [Bacteroidetes bacterium]|nr:uracil phosphoribosyltransferase [Bacteroidota bacterium]
MKAFFEGIAWLFEEILFLPYEVLRELELTSWTLANSVNWIFLIVGFSAMVYWLVQLNIFEKSGEEDKDPSAHSFL